MFATSKTLSRSLVLLSMMAVACGAKVDEVGDPPNPDDPSDPAPIVPQPDYDAKGPVVPRIDGQPSGDGTSCALDGIEWGDKKHGTIPPGISLHLGETIALADACSACRCTKQGLECETDSFCAEVVKAQEPRGLRSCTFRGQTYAAGDVFIGADPCGSVCSCADGTVDCSARSCNDACPVPQKTPPGISCAAVVVTVRAPDGTCCTYGDGCGAPDGWPAFSNEADCLDRP